jgi:hypothetical protein
MLLAVPTVLCQSDILKPVSDVANEGLEFDMLVGKSVERTLEKGGLNVIECCCLIIFFTYLVNTLIIQRKDAPSSQKLEERCVFFIVRTFQWPRTI